MWHEPPVLIYIARVGTQPCCKIACTTMAPARLLANLQIWHTNPVRLIRLVRGTPRQARDIVRRFQPVAWRAKWYWHHPDMEAGDFGLTEVPLPPIEPQHARQISPTLPFRGGRGGLHAPIAR